MTRVRYSLLELQRRYDTGEDKTSLETLVRAFRGIQSLPPSHLNSFFVIGSYHGEPFVADLPPYGWGGYCNHENVLFLTWHRAYLMRLENALRTIPGCANVTIPFWDECFNPPPYSEQNPRVPLIIPQILTSKTFTLDGKTIGNPLYSYALQRRIATPAGPRERYAKPKGYETVRYPLSGLVGTKSDQDAAAAHNALFSDPSKNVALLNANLASWLAGDVKIPRSSDPATQYPDTTSVYAKFLRSLEAPNYTVFSNTTSARAWNEEKEKISVANPMADSDFVVPLESPHNAIHLAVGGFYQDGVFIASPIKDANGDMGANETASFDPIFFFHHCFIDYVFWRWQQKHGMTEAGSLVIIPGYRGTISTGLPGQPAGTLLTEDTPLLPFTMPTTTNPYTTRLVTDIVNQLGYDYGPGSLDPIALPHTVVSASPAPNIVTLKRIHNINRAKIPGSFVIRLYAKFSESPQEKFEIGREAILSRWSTDGCANCQGTLDVEVLVPIYDGFLDLLATHVGNTQAAITFDVELDTRGYEKNFEIPVVDDF